MAEMGHQRRLAQVRTMSCLPPATDATLHVGIVAYGLEADARRWPTVASHSYIER
jgi:hypothetical protein